MSEFDRRTLLERLEDSRSRSSDRESLLEQLRKTSTEPSGPPRSAAEKVRPSHSRGAGTLEACETLADVLARRAPRASREKLLERLHPEVEDSTRRGPDRNAVEQELAQAEWQMADQSELREDDWRAQFSAPIPDYAEQVALAKTIEAGILAQGVLDDEVVVRSNPPVEELEQLARAGLQAMETFVTGNLRLVVHWAYRSAPLLDVQDKFQYGVFGLVRAVERWDWRRGYTFATYASWHVRQAISRGIANDSRVIRIPVHVQDDLHAELGGAAGAEPDDREVAKAARLILAGVLSLDDLAGELDESPDDFDYRCADPATWMLERTAYKAVVGDALEALDDRELRIIQSRAGMFTDPLTLDQIGKLEGVSRERIRQIESLAEQKLRSELWDLCSKWESDRRVFRVAADENPKVVRAVLELSGSRRVWKVAKRFELDESAITDALRRFQSAAD